MKKLLIVNNNMYIGGVQKALMNLLWNIYEKYDITLLLFYAGGLCREELPPQIKVIETSSFYRYLGMNRQDAAKTGKDRLIRSGLAAITRIFGRKAAISIMKSTQGKIVGYDVAISYLHNGGKNAFYGGCNDFVLDHVSASKKITFVHCDYLHSGANTTENNEQYNRFDIIAACSEGCAASFAEANPHLSDKITVVQNCHRFQKIREKALEDPIKKDKSRINIVTVARLGKEKGVARAVEAIAQLGDLKEKIHYHIVGDGIEREKIRRLIGQYSLEKAIEWCGEKENPYGYIKAADLILIPSYSEAAPMVIGEAACLGTAILSTRTSSAEEMIIKKSLGWVCDNSVEGLVETLKALLEDPYALHEKKKEMSMLKMDNEEALCQFLEMVEE